MFPVRCQCVNNPMYLSGFLGELNVSEEILKVVDRDPAVVGHKVNYEQALAKFQPFPKVGQRVDQIPASTWKNAIAFGLPLGSPACSAFGGIGRKSQYQQRMKECRERAAREGLNQRVAYYNRDYFSGSSISASKRHVTQKFVNDYMAKANAAVAGQLAALNAARERAYERISNAIPYKGHVIKPKIENGQVNYYVTFDISNKTGKFRSPEEAKAAIDNEVALGPGGLKAKEDFEQKAKEVGEQQAAQIIAQQQAAQRQAEAGADSQQRAPSAVPPPKKGMSTAAKVGIGAAAVGAAFLLTR